MLEVARAILILGTGVGITSEMYHISTGCLYATPLLWALDTLTTRVNCPLGIGNSARLADLRVYDSTFSNIPLSCV